jgi:ATP-dependent helicase HrpA
VFGHGSLTDVLLKKARDETSLDIKRGDFKHDMLSPHLFMNLCVVDEYGRQLGMGRNLGALKGELGAKARGAFQALAQLKVAAAPAAAPAALTTTNAPTGTQGANRNNAAQVKATAAPKPLAPQRYTAWTFGELPELMEISKGGQTLIGFPALVDMQDAVTIEVFDEPEVAASKNRAGLRRLFALQIKDALKYLEKNIPDLQKMAVAYMPLGTADELKNQIIDVALDRAFLLDPLPNDETTFKRRIEEGRGRLTLIANEVARLAGSILLEFGAATRKIKDTKNAPDATADCTQQLQRLMPRNFMAATPWPQLQHYARYLKAITLRLDKYRADPARDAQRLTELKPQEQRYWRLVAERKGAQDARMLEFRWLLEELRVSFFAQELRTPQPVSIKRLEKAWGQLNH